MEKEKCLERLKMLKDKNLWSEEKSPLGLAKVKMQRVKVKKDKAAPAEGAAGAAPAAGAPAKAAAPAGKEKK